VFGTAKKNIPEECSAVKKGASLLTPLKNYLTNELLSIFIVKIDLNRIF
jgi:hypothetical protein